jgi:hypothetical protein
MKSSTFGLIVLLIRPGAAPPPPGPVPQSRVDVLTERGLGNGSTAPPVPLKPGVTTVLGRVVEAGTTSGVPGALVRLAGAALGPFNVPFTNGTPGGDRLVATDSQGRFLFRELPPGTYTLTSTASGYVEGNYGETRIVQIRRTLDLIRSVDVTEADKLVTVDIQMWRNGGILGRRRR